MYLKTFCDLRAETRLEILLSHLQMRTSEPREASEITKFTQVPNIQLEPDSQQDTLLNYSVCFFFNKNIFSIHRQNSEEKICEFDVVVKRFKMLVTQ